MTMIRDILHSMRQSVSDPRVRQASAVVGLCILLALSMSPVAPVSAQQDNETVPQCDQGPPIPGQEEGSDIDLEVALVSDRSNSMSPGRIGDLQTASNGFVDRLEDDDEAAAISWANTATLDQELTTDHAAVKDEIDALDDRLASGTESAAGLETGQDELLNGTNASSNATKVMLFSTDAAGSDWQQPTIDQAEIAKERGIIIFGIGIGDDVDEQALTEVSSGDGDRAFIAPDSSDLESIYQEISGDVEGIQGSQLTIDTRSLFQPGETHGYRVTNTTVVNNQTTTEDVTSETSVNTSNTSLLTADEQAAELTATSDPAASDGVVITADHDGETGCVNAIVAEASMENLELLPTTWRITTFLGNWTTFLFLISIGAGIVGTRLATSFMGLSMMELVLITGWFGGYLSTGLVMTSVFACLFIGLNLAANIDYQVQR